MHRAVCSVALPMATTSVTGLAVAAEAAGVGPVALIDTNPQCGPAG
jgi:hypothetical protein